MNVTFYATDDLQNKKKQMKNEKLTITQIYELDNIITFALASKEAKSSYIENYLNLGKTEIEQANNVAVGIIATDLKNFMKKYGG